MDKAYIERARLVNDLSGGIDIFWGGEQHQREEKWDNIYTIGLGRRDIAAHCVNHCVNPVSGTISA
jgi:hypothetical protein